MKKQLLLSLMLLSAGLSASAQLATHQGINYYYTSQTATIPATGETQTTYQAFAYSLANIDAMPAEYVIPQALTINDQSYTVTTIFAAAFQSNTKLQSIEMNPGLQTLTSSCFSGCTNLTKATLSENISTIKESAFQGCSSLREVNIPYMCTAIEKQAFANCTSLPYIIIERNVNSIGELAFYGCNNLTDIGFYGATPPSVAANTFSGLGNVTIHVLEGYKDAYAAAFASAGITPAQIVDGTEGQEPAVCESIRFTVNASTGSTYRDNNVSTLWCSKWVSTLDVDTPTLVIENGSGNNGKLCQSNNGLIDFRGWAPTTQVPDPSNAKWYVKVENPKYYVSEISFKANGSGVNVNGEPADGTLRTYTFDDTNTVPCITIDKNSQCLFSDFVITLTRREFYVEPESWYVIKSLTVAENMLAGLNPNGVYRHSNGDYSMAWLPFSGEDYSTVSPDCYVHVEDVYKPNGYMIIRSNNGMYMNPDCTADREPQQTKLQMIDLSDYKVRIGGTWSTFAQSASDANVITTPVTGLGQSGNATNNFLMTKVNPRERFDIYTVNILRVEDVHEESFSLHYS